MLFALLFSLSQAFAAPPAPDQSLAEWSAEREEKLLSVVEERAPDRYQELVALREQDPVAYVMALHEVARMAREGAAGGPGGGGPGQEGGGRPPESPRVAEIQTRIDVLMTDFGTQSAGEQKKRRTEIEALAGEMFDLRQVQRRAHLADVKAKVASLEADIADRDARRDELIGKWVERRLSGKPTPR